MTEILTIKTDTTGIVNVTLNRPDYHNSLNTELITSLLDELQKIKHSPSARIFILSASGTTFCSGGDLRELQELNEDYASKLAMLMQELYLCPIPTIARVHASAYGGGVGLITCCDYAIATPGTCLALTELKLGLIPATICPYLVAAIGPKQTKQLILCAEKITSGRAFQLGLLSKIVSADNLDHEMNRLCDSLLKAGPEAIKQSKKLVDSIINIDQIQNIDTAKWLTEVQQSDEAIEGIASFFEKRNPNWVPIKN